MEIINLLEWEALSDPIEFEIIDRGDLHEGIKRGTLSRGQELELEFLAEGDIVSSALHGPTQLKKGEFLQPTADIYGTTKSGTKVRLIGPQVSTWNSTGARQLQINAICDQAELIYSNNPTINHVDWIVNYDRPSTQRHTRVTERRWEKRFLRIIDKEIEADYDNTQQFTETTLSSDHFRIEVELNKIHYSIAVGEPPGGVGDPKLKPGYIKYSTANGNIPSDEQRAIILEALSFSFGRNFIHIGHSQYDRNWRIVSSRCRVAGFQGGRDQIQNSSRPPVDYADNTQQYWLDENKLARSVNSFLGLLYKLDAVYPLWLFFLGQSSPLEVATAQYGAAIESLRKAYFRSNSAASTILFLPQDWLPLEQNLMESVSEFLEILRKDYPEEVKILSNKINQLNNKSSNMQYPEFFKLINLPTGKVEAAALKERNLPAHGHRYEPTEYAVLSAKTYALMTLFNRIIIKMAKSADSYIDYSTYGHPIRAIDQPMGGPKGTGEPAG